MLDYDKVVSEAVGTFFGVLQAITVFALVAAVKTWVDVQKLKRDMDAAWKAIRGKNDNT